ncbi:hypothetical protein NL676_019901 [Syzygium grande]|nr:hypothetical protein NL676_019901 [Syzygium grande]
MIFALRRGSPPNLLPSSILHVAPRMLVLRATVANHRRQVTAADRPLPGRHRPRRRRPFLWSAADRPSVGFVVVRPSAAHRWIRSLRVEIIRRRTRRHAGRRLGALLAAGAS